MMNTYYVNAFSESMIIFIQYVLALIAAMSAYKLIPRRFKPRFRPEPGADDIAGTPQH